jgi:hypothetical protein
MYGPNDPTAHPTITTGTRVPGDHYAYEQEPREKDKVPQSFEAFAREAQARCQESREAGQQGEIQVGHTPVPGTCSRCGKLLSRAAGFVQQASGKTTCALCWRLLRGLGP